MATRDRTSPQSVRGTPFDRLRTGFDELSNCGERIWNGVIQRFLSGAAFLGETPLPL